MNWGSQEGFIPLFLPSLRRLLCEYLKRLNIFSLEALCHVKTIQLQDIAIS
jgi:hypothetical protein